MFVGSVGAFRVGWTGMVLASHPWVEINDSFCVGTVGLKKAFSLSQQEGGCGNVLERLKLRPVWFSELGGALDLEGQ